MRTREGAWGMQERQWITIRRSELNALATAQNREGEPEELLRQEQMHGLLVIALTDDRGRLLWIKRGSRSAKSLAGSATSRSPPRRRPDTPREQIEKLVTLVENRSPICDSLVSPVDVVTTLA